MASSKALPPFPINYKDAVYSDADAKTTARLGLPVGMLDAIRTAGEKSNADQVSSAGARTPYQITPATRRAILDQYGIDAYLSPENASEAAGILLRDSLKRSGGDPETAVREYHGGTDPKNWGKVNEAYWRRVSAGMRDTAVRAMSDAFGQWMASNPAQPAAKPAAPTGGASDALSNAFGAWLKGSDQIPGSAIPADRLPPALGLPPKQAPQEPGIVDKAIGAGEAALSTLTGATGGALGMAGGTVKGLANAVASGTYGTKAGADAVEQAAVQGAQALTYAPRTEQGQEYAHKVGEAMQQMLPVAGLTGMIPPGVVAPAANAARTGAAAVLDKAAIGLPETVRNMRAAAGEAIPAIAEKPVAEVPAAVSQMAPQELAATARKAAEGGIGSGKAERVLAEQAAPDPAKLAAAERLGITEYLQPDHITSSEAYRQVAAVLKSANPGSPLSLAEREGLGKVAQRANDLIEQIGGSHDLSSVDASVKSRMLGTVKSLEDQADTLYSTLRERIPAKTEAPADNTLAFIRARAEQLDGAQNLTPMERRILARLSPQERVSKEAVARDPLIPGSTPAFRNVTTTRQPTYTLLDDVRRDVGAAARQRGPFKDADTGLAKKLYELLTQDQEKVANAAGMSDVLTAAKAAVAQRKGLEDDLAALFGRDLDRSLLRGGEAGVPGAVARLAKGDSSALTRLLSHVPEDMRQNVVASGLGAYLRKAGAEGQLDFTGYAKLYEALRANRQAYAATMANLPPSARKQLAALYQVSRGVSDSLNRRIGTGRLATVKEELLGKEALMDRLYSLATRSAAGAAIGGATGSVLGPGFGAAVGAALAKSKPRSVLAVEELVASPEFAHMVRTAAGTKQEAVAVKAVAKSRAFNRFVRSLGKTRAEIPADREAWLLNAMRAPAPQQQDNRTLH